MSSVIEGKPNRPRGPKPFTGILLIKSPFPQRETEPQAAITFAEHFTSKNMAILFDEYFQFFGDEGILIEPIHAPVNGVIKTLGFKITTHAGIEEFIKGGGKIILPHAFKHINFTKIPKNDALELRVAAPSQTGDIDRDEVVKSFAKTFQSMGVEYTQQDGVFTIQGRNNLTALAISGASFADSSQYIGKAGYKAR